MMISPRGQILTHQSDQIKKSNLFFWQSKANQRPIIDYGLFENFFRTYNFAQMFSEINGELKVINDGILNLIGQKDLGKNHLKLISLEGKPESVFSSFRDENMFCLYKKSGNHSFLSCRNLFGNSSIVFKNFSKIWLIDWLIFSLFWLFFFIVEKNQIPNYIYCIFILKL